MEEEKTPRMDFAARFPHWDNCAQLRLGSASRIEQATLYAISHAETKILIRERREKDQR
jgi:hypothetical protein